MEKRFYNYNFLRIFFLILAGAAGLIFTVRVVQAGHLGSACFSGYCVSASGSYSGAGPTFTGQVTVSQPIPPYSQGNYCPKLAARWVSPNLGIQEQQVFFWQSSPCSQETTFVQKSFSFPGVAGGRNYYEGAATIWWWNGSGFSYITTLNTPSVAVDIPLPPADPTLASISVTPNPANFGNPITVNFNSPANADFCLFQYKLSSQGPAFWSPAVQGLCSGISFTPTAAGIYDVRGTACNNAYLCATPYPTTVVTINPSLPTITSFTATGGGQSGSDITVPVGTPVTFDWSTSGAVSCSSTGVLGSFPSLPLQGPSSPVVASVVGGPFTQNLTCSNASGSSPPATVSVTVTGPPAAPTLSITPLKTIYATNEAVTISWVQPPQPAGTNYYLYINGGTGIYAGCTRSLGGCQTSLTGATGRIGDVFTVGAGRFVEVEACNSVGQCSSPSNRLTFDVNAPAVTVNYTIEQTVIPGVNSSNVFPMATSRIAPLHVGLTVPGQTSAQLTLYYSPDGVAAESPVTSGVIWSSNSSRTTVNNNGLVSTSLTPVDNCISGSPNCYLLQYLLDTAQIMAVYRDKVATSWVQIYGYAWTFGGGEGGNQ